ncbi:hypothetical protein ACFL1B_03055 [Nanoarchaeota archaeon]
MVGKRGWLLAFLLMIPLASGITVGGVSFTIDEPEFGRHGIPITSVSTNYPRLATMHFTIEGGTFDSINLDTSQLATLNRAKNLRPGSTADGSCVGSTGYDCQVDDVLLRPTSGSGTIPYTLSAGGDSQSSTMDFSFAVDNSRPIVGQIRGGLCDGPTCYVGSNLMDIEIEMQDSPGTFENGFVFYYVNNLGPYMVDSCEGMICKGFISSNCAHGNTVTFEIGSYNGVPSQDDAGNPVDKSRGQPQKIFQCDNQGPEVIFFNWTTHDFIFFNFSTPLIPRMYILQNDTITITVHVEEDARLEGIADLRGFGGSNETHMNCIPGNPQICTVDVFVEKPGYRKFTVPFYFRDYANHQTTYEHEFEIQVISASPDDVYRITDMEVSPDTLNRNTLELFDKEVFVSLTLNKNFANASILQQIVHDCHWSDPFYGFDYKLITEGLNPVIQFTIPTMAAFMPQNDTTINCSITMDSFFGDYTYPGSETEVFFFDIHLVGFWDVPAMLEETIKANVRKTKDLRNFLSKVKTFMNFATGMCRIIQISEAAQGVAAGGEFVACQIGEAFTPAQVITMPVQLALRGVQSALGKLGTGLYDIAGKVCDFLTCQQDWLGLSDYVWDKIPGTSQLEEIGLTKEVAFRPEDSLFWSAATGCLPGVISNTEQYLQIQCEYERCLGQDAMLYGIPASACREIKSYNECRYIIGQTSAIGSSIIINAVKDVVVSHLTNPYTIGAFIGGMVLKNVCPVLPPAPPNVCIASSGACAILPALDAASSFKSLWQNIKQTIGMFSQKGITPDADFCDLANALPDPDLTPTAFELYKDTRSMQCDSISCFDGRIAVNPDGSAYFMGYSANKEATGFNYVVELGSTYYGVNPVHDGSGLTFTITETSVGPEHVNAEYVKQISYLSDGNFKIKQELGGRTKDVTDNYENKIDAQRQQLEQGANAKPQEEKNAEQTWRNMMDVINLWNSIRVAYAKGKITDYDDFISTVNSLEQSYCGSGYDVCSLATEQAISRIRNQCTSPENQACSNAIKDLDKALEDDFKSHEGALPQPGTFSFNNIGKTMVESARLGDTMMYFLPTKFMKSWRDSVNNWVDDKLSLTNTLANKWCEADFDMPDVGVISAPGLGRRPSMAVQGYINEWNNSYEYKVTATVFPPPEDMTVNTITFMIQLMTEDNSKVLVLHGPETLDSNSAPFHRGRDETLYNMTSIEYHKACIRFQSTYVPYTDLNNMFCNELIGDDE